MNRPRGLASAKQVDKPGHDRIHPRRHREAGQDHQRQQDEDDAEIGQFLDWVVTPRCLATRKFQPQMIGCIVEKSARPQLLLAGEEVAPKMPGGESGHEINQEVRDKCPRKKEMPAAPQGEIAPAGKRCPSRDAAPDDLAAGIAGDAEDPGGCECR